MDGITAFVERRNKGLAGTAEKGLEVGKKRGGGEGLVVVDHRRRVRSNE